ncbi:MAG: Spore coat polysaccharide biosynthesis protein spsE [Bacteroidota bacterium]|jgi:N-acetylneuraminate synthase
MGIKKTIIIAEAGVNHNGNLNIAKRLIDAAVDAGVDYVKFQTFKTENLVSPSAPKADYQIENTQNQNETQYQMLKNLELSMEDHYELIAYCNKKNINFFSTAFDLESLDFLHSLNFSLFKIPSGEITNYPYLYKIGSFKKEVIISTGMCTMQEIEEAIEVLINAGTDRNRITVLHCNTEYPTPMIDVNLKAMLDIQEKLKVPIGYSDHTLGIEVPIAAVALGACVIEKHFTLDKSMHGPDHAASLEPIELKEMVAAIRNIELVLSGDGVKNPSNSEQKNITIARKSIVAKTGIKKGEAFTVENITTKRPANGISAMKWKEVMGTIAKKDYNAEELIEI